MANTMTADDMAMPRKSQANNSHNIDLVIPEYVSFSIRCINVSCTEYITELLHNNNQYLSLRRQ